MGKVYEALDRSDRESQDLFSKPDGKGRVAAAEPRSFDFLQYSLNASRSGDRSAALRGGGPWPAREINLDVTRIEPRLVAFTDAERRVSDEYGRLAINLISASAVRPFKRVLVSSVQRGEGRTCVTLNLACSLARAKKRVIVIDADLHRPSVSRMLGIDTEVGLAEAVSQGLPASLASVTLRPTGLDVLPMREQVDNSAELLTAGSFHNLIQTLDSAYDFILFDSPPLFAGGDSAFLVRLTDATLLVVCPGKTNVAQLEKAVAPLSKENIVGVVINRTAQA